MTKPVKTALILLLTVYFFSLSASAQENEREIVKSVKTVTGRFVRFVVGDYIHAQIIKSNGKTEYYFLDSYKVQYFLVVNRGKTMTFIYDVVATYPDANGKRPIIERMKSARIGQLTFEKWLKDLEKRYSYEDIKKKYEPLVDKYTKDL